MSNSDPLPTPLSHPGLFVRSAVVQPSGLTVKEAAEALGVHRVALSRLLNEQAALSAEMAIRLQKAFGVDMEMLMRMQSDYDIAQAKSRFDRVSISPISLATLAERRKLSKQPIRKKSVSVTNGKV
ncbi:HigA family addiction module antidote protein [Rhizobium bangladeshense]|nr:HigA family addiction module antidote protein [Rhizobium bangladeshense]